MKAASVQRYGHRINIKTKHLELYLSLQSNCQQYHWQLPVNALTCHHAFKWIHIMATANLEMSEEH